MGSPNASGDGKTSPFGDGKGGQGSGQQMGDNGVPESFHQSRKQQSGRDPDINPAEIPPGGPSVFPDLDPKKPDPGNPIGTTAGEKGGRKPFKGI